MRLAMTPPPHPTLSPKGARAKKEKALSLWERVGVRALFPYVFKLAVKLRSFTATSSPVRAISAIAQ